MAARIVSPALLVGLGDHASHVASACLTFFSEENPELRRIVSAILLQNDGKFVHVAGGSPEQQEDRVELEVGNLQADTYPGVFNTFLSRENEICNYVEARLRELSPHHLSSELKLKGYEVRNIHQVLIFTSSFDVIGSSTTLALLAFLGFLKRAKNISLEVSLYILLADLSSESDLEKKRIEATRSFAFLRELDSELTLARDHPSEAGWGVRLTWLIGSRNLNGHSIQGIEQISRVVANVTESLLAYRVLGDFSFLHVLSEHFDGRGRFYSSFGSSRIIYPEREVIDLLADCAISDALGNLLSTIELRKFERSAVFSDCRNFLLDNNLTTLDQQLSKGTDGNDIFQEFTAPSVPLDEKLLPPEYFLMLRATFEEYHRRATDASTITLPNRANQFFDQVTQILLNGIKERIDHEYRGLGYCDAFLSSLQDTDSEFLTGESLDLEYSMAAAEEPIRDFYKKALGIDIKEAQLRRVEEDIKGKRRLIDELERRKRSLEQRSMVVSSEADQKKMQIELQRLNDRLVSIPKEIEALEKQFEELTNEIETLKAQIDDPGRRRDIKASAEQAKEMEIAELEEEITHLDNKRRSTEQELIQLEELKRIVTWRICIIYPLAATGVVGIVGLALWEFNIIDISGIISDLIQSLDYAIAGASGLILLYGIFSYLYYWFRIGKKLRDARQLRDNLILAKRSAMARLKAAYNSLARTSWEHNLYNEALEWFEEFRSWVANHSQKLREFRENLDSLLRQATERWGSGKIPESILERSVISKEDIKEYYEHNRFRLSKFFKEKPISAYYAMFVADNTISQLSKNLREYLREEYIELVKTGVENILDGKSRFSTKRSLILENWITAAYDAAAPLVYLSTSERLKPEEKVGICVPNKDESIALDVTHRHYSFTKDHFHSTGDKNFIEINRFLIGFTLFQLGEVKYYASAYDELTKKGVELHIDRDKYKNHPIFPSLLASVGEQDEVLRAIVLGRLTRIIEKNADGELNFGGNAIGKSTEEALKFFMTVRAKAAKKALLKQVSQDMKERSEVCTTKLREFLESEDADDSDMTYEKKVAQNLLRELDPLA